MMNTVGIIGTQLAEFFLLKNFNVIVKTVSNDMKSSFSGTLGARISKRNTKEVTERALMMLSITTDYHDLRESDFIIEAAGEVMTLYAIDGVNPPFSRWTRSYPHSRTCAQCLASSIRG